MKRKAMTVAAILFTTSVLMSGADPVMAQHPLNEPPGMESMEKKKKTSQRMHPLFSWDRPGPISPVLHKGSPRSAGMMNQPLKEMDPAIEALIEEGAMPGAVAFVARRGHIVKHEAYGNAYQYTDGEFTEADNPISMKEDTIFDVASISKIFTTVAAMKLYEEGEFQLDDPVSHYIPEFEQNGKEAVTIRQLMTHTSGFEPGIPLYSQANSRDERLQLVFSHDLEAEPGTQYTYSDLNMITLGALVERLSGDRLDVFVKKYITGPLGMKNTMYNPPESLKPRIAATEDQSSIGRGLVWGEVHDENAWSLEGVAGHAGVFSTAEDLGKLAHMFINEGEYAGKQILKAETVKLLEENQNEAFPGDDHGLGWELGQGWYMDALSEGSTLGHTGYTGTSIVVNKNNATISILLTNRVHPTRETVSTNPARRQVARLTADAIPVAMPSKKKAWFSGYGDELNRTLTAEVKAEKGAVLTFDTWYRIENESDYGYIEVSKDGKNWTSVGAPYTGTSIDWKKSTVLIPKGSTYIRFRYDTDATVNGRGWYIHDAVLKQSNGKDIKLKLSTDGWEKRRY
ncbi:serine hydrolase [Cytobacillus gottheilii]|uniref:serine hydrolase domain-containing protein n=1 Tax=Cytobacillus gottheilii TaxID=859144 RepID=UPI003F5C9241